MICAKNVSFPVLVTSTLSKPCLFIVAPMTGSPVFLFTGIDSPVASDSSIKDSPSMTFPSEGIFSPGFMIITSPTDSSDVKTSISCPSTRILAVFAPNSISFLIANDALPLALDSKNFPIKWNVMIVVAISMNVVIGKKSPSKPIKYGGSDPKDTKTSILGLLALRDLKLALCTCEPNIKTTGNPMSATITVYPKIGMINMCITISVIITAEIDAEINIFFLAFCIFKTSGSTLTSISSSSMMS